MRKQILRNAKRFIWKCQFSFSTAQSFGHLESQRNQNTFPRKQKVLRDCKLFSNFNIPDICATVFSRQFLIIAYSQKTCTVSEALVLLARMAINIKADSLWRSRCFFLDESIVPLVLFAICIESLSRRSITCTKCHRNFSPWSPREILSPVE